MAGKKRRTRCNQCKGMFQFGEEGEVTHKLHSIYKTYKLNHVFCSSACLFDYAVGITTMGGNDE